MQVVKVHRRDMIDMQVISSTQMPELLQGGFACP
jgi:hypothetical protein